jgi:hypothetical protein
LSPTQATWSPAAAELLVVPNPARDEEPAAPLELPALAAVDAANTGVATTEVIASPAATIADTIARVVIVLFIVTEFTEKII